MTSNSVEIYKQCEKRKAIEDAKLERERIDQTNENVYAINQVLSKLTGIKQNYKGNENGEVVIDGMVFYIDNVLGYVTHGLLPKNLHTSENDLL